MISWMSVVAGSGCYWCQFTVLPQPGGNCERVCILGYKFFFISHVLGSLTSVYYKIMRGLVPCLPTQMCPLITFQCDNSVRGVMTDTVHAYFVVYKLETST